MCRESWTAIRVEKFLGNLSKHQPSRLYCGTCMPGAGAPGLSMFGSDKERTLERNHGLPGTSYDCYLGMEVGTDAQPRQPPKSPKGGRDPLGESSEATRKEEMRDAK